jgi:hypothetical protein
VLARSAAQHAREPRRACAARRLALFARVSLCRSARAHARAPTATQLFVQCKRGQLDMRTRIRGNKGY